MIRYYKGRYQVKILDRDRNHWLVKALEEVFCPSLGWKSPFAPQFMEGDEFRVNPRLLWKRMRKVRR